MRGAAAALLMRGRSGVSGGRPPVSEVLELSGRAMLNGVAESLGLGYYLRSGPEGGLVGTGLSVTNYKR